MLYKNALIFILFSRFLNYYNNNGYFNNNRNNLRWQCGKKKIFSLIIKTGILVIIRKFKRKANELGKPISCHETLRFFLFHQQPDEETQLKRIRE